MSSEISSEEPKKKEFPRLAQENTAKTPLDESGFFKKGRVDSDIIRRFTCGQEDCTDGIFPLIIDQGVRNIGQVYEVYNRYKDIAVKLHQAKLSPKTIIEF